MNPCLIRLPLLLLFFWGFISNAQSPVAGQVDLSKANFENGEVINASGEWEFYWDKLLTPPDFEIPQNPELIRVPGSWHRMSNHASLGFGTYRLRVHLAESGSGLGLYFRIINSSAKVWVNGKLVVETGVVSADKKQYNAQLKGTLVPLPDRTSDLEIIIQAANYSYFSGGITGEPLIGSSAVLFEQINKANSIQNFFAGCLMAMFFYQIILFFLFDKGKPYLWLALICLGVALRAMIVQGGSFLLPTLYPDVPFEYWKKIEFGCVYVMIAIFPLYVYNLFPEQSPKKPLYFLTSVGIIMGSIVLLTRQYTYGSLLEVVHLLLICTFVYAFYSIGKAWRAGNKDARIILFGLLASFPFILGEIIKNSPSIPLNIEFNYMVEMGVLVFLLFQVYLLANHFAKSYKNLEALNLNLEKVVNERTTQLTAANKVRDRLLSVMSHDVRSPLNALRGILQVYNRGDIKQEEFGPFARHIENDLSNTSLLVENILYWTTNQLKGVMVRKEKFDLHVLMQENMELFQTVASHKKVSITHDVTKGFNVTVDRNILNFAIRNLLANAIKFSYEGGDVSVIALRENGKLSIQIKDRGTGMDENTIQGLLKVQQNLTTTGTGNEKGTGLGVALCSDYLQKGGGQLSVESILGEGTTFTITLPVG